MFSVQETTATQITVAASNILESKVTLPAITNGNNANTNGANSNLDNVEFMPYNQSAQTTLQFTFVQLLMIMWVTASVAVLTTQIVRLNKLNYKLKRLTALPPQHNDVVRECFASANVKPIKILTGYGFSSPALTVALKPKIIIPYEIATGSREELKFALLHELTHYKQKHHIVMVIWNVLKIIYPFNPVVWLGVNHMRKDMESACDLGVTKGMQRDVKKRYAQLILNLYAMENTQTSLALFSVKKEAMRRIKSIFSLQKTKAFFKIVSVMLCATIFILFFTTACTPAIIAVERVVEEKIQTPLSAVSTSNTPQKPEYIKIDAPFSIIKDVVVNNEEIGPITVKFDASVTYPQNITEMPLYSATMVKDNTELFNKLANYFIGDGEFTDFEGNVVSLDGVEYVEELDTVNNDAEAYDLFKDKKEFNTENLKVITDVAGEDNILIDKTKSVYIRKDNNYPDAVHEGYLYPYYKTGTIWPFSYVTYVKNYISNNKTVADYDVNKEMDSFDFALNIAQKTLTELDLENYVLVSSGYANYIDNSGSRNPKEFTMWSFAFNQKLENGMHSNINTIFFNIEEDEVVIFTYDNIAKITGKSENMKIIGIDESFIKNCAQKIVNADNNMPTINDTPDDINITVNKIYLEYRNIPKSDSTDEQILTPVWQIKYTLNLLSNYLSINAVTGEIVDNRYP